MGGRITLINRVLECIPTYSMSLHPITSKALKQLDKTRRNFFYGKEILEATNFIWSSGIRSCCQKPKRSRWPGHQRPSTTQPVLTNEVAMEKHSGRSVAMEGSHYYQTWSLESLVL